MDPDIKCIWFVTLRSDIETKRVLVGKGKVEGTPNADSLEPFSPRSSELNLVQRAEQTFPTEKVLSELSPNCFICLDMAKSLFLISSLSSNPTLTGSSEIATVAYPLCEAAACARFLASRYKVISKRFLKQKRAHYACSTCGLSEEDSACKFTACAICNGALYYCSEDCLAEHQQSCAVIN